MLPNNSHSEWPLMPALLGPFANYHVLVVPKQALKALWYSLARVTDQDIVAPEIQCLGGD